MKESTERKITGIIFAGSFGITTVALVLLSLKQPLRSNIVASYLWIFLLVAGTACINRLTGTRRPLFRIFLLISVINLLIVPPEAFLRLKEFHYESGIQFGYPRPYQFKVFEPHEKLFWRFPPARPGINAYGFAGREVETPKSKGAFRILFIGNSCTYQGYPQTIELILKARHPGLECLNFATPGYTSYQGKLILNMYIDELEPDLVVAAFGWNDRWLAYGAVDEEKEIHIARSASADVMRLVYSKWRLLQFFRKVFEPVLGRVEPLDVPRVPIDHFKGNLREIGRHCLERGIPVVFATEPSSHIRLGVPDYIVKSKYARTDESFLDRLVEYNDTIRKVAGERNDWYLIDLDKAISERNDVGDIFERDGFHFTRSGLALVAEIEARFIETHFLRVRD